MSKTVHVFDYLARPGEHPPEGVCVLFGDEPFLRRLALEQLRGAILGDEEDVPFARLEGKQAEWRDVADELSTVSLFGGGRPRLVVIDEADVFIQAHRSRLEDYAAAPKKTGILILLADSFPSNTRLFKAVAKNGLALECRAPEKAGGRNKKLDEPRLCKWLAAWSKTQHNAALEPTAAELLLELIGPEFGLLDGELAKLALFVEADGRITPEMVRDTVGGWKTKTTWDLLDAAADGDAGEAIRQLDRLLASGEHPLSLFGRISWSLRRFADATSIFEHAERAGRKISLQDALEQAGFRKWPRGALAAAQRQLLQLGRERAGHLHRWLLDADLALKGTHSTPTRARQTLELLFVRMSRQLSPKAKKRPTATARR